MYPQHNDRKARFFLRLRELLRAIASRLPESSKISQKRKAQEKENNSQLHQNIPSSELVSLSQDFHAVMTFLARNLRSLEFGSPNRIVNTNINETHQATIPAKCSYQAYTGAIRQRRYIDQATRARSYRHADLTPKFTEQVTNSTKHHHRRKGSSQMTAPLRMLYVFMLLLAIFVLPATATYKVYRPEAGLYVEHIGTGKVSRGTFRIDVQFSYAKLEEDLKSVNNAVQQMNQLCENMKSQLGEESCNYLLFHLSQLEKQAIRIKASLDSYTIRQKRSLGKFLTSLFHGNEDVYEDISYFATKQRGLDGASLYHAKSLLSDVTELNDSDTNIKMELDNFLTKLKEAFNSKPDTSTTSHKNQLYIHIFSSYEAATNYINEIIDYYTPLLNIQMHRSSLYDVLPSDTIDKTIEAASMKLPSDLKILSKPLLDTKIRRDKDTIYIHGYFPIRDSRDFTLLKVIPVPLRIERNYYWFLDIPSDIIAVDYDSQLYFYQSDDDLRSAIQIEDNEYLCTPKTIRKMEENPSCVIDNIYAQTINNTCEIKRDDITSIIWKELYTENAWMFITNKATTISVLCDGSRDDVPINNSGILKISQNCFIQTQRNILTPKREDVIHVISTYSKYVPVNLSKTITLQSQHPRGGIEEPVINVFNAFRTMQEQVNEFQEELDSRSVEVNGIKHQGVVSNVVTGASAVSIILAALVTYRATETFWKKLIPHTCSRQTSERSEESSRLIPPSDSSD